MKILDWLLGAKCEGCGQRNKPSRGHDSVPGDDKLLCVACHGELQAEKRKEDKADKFALLSQLWSRIGFDERGKEFNSRIEISSDYTAFLGKTGDGEPDRDPALMIVGESDAALEMRLMLIRSAVMKGDLPGTTWIVLQSSSSTEESPRFEPKITPSGHTLYTEKSTFATRRSILLAIARNREWLQSLADPQDRSMHANLQGARTWTTFNNAMHVLNEEPRFPGMKKGRQIPTKTDQETIESPSYFYNLLSEFYRGYYKVREVVALGDGITPDLVERFRSRGVIINRKEPAVSRHPATNNCAKCGGSFKWPDSFKSGPIRIPANIIDTAIYCPTCDKKFCIQCVCGKCPQCGGGNYKHVSATST